MGLFITCAATPFERREWGWFRDGPIPLLSKEGGRAAAGVVSKRSRSLLLSILPGRRPLFQERRHAFEHVVGPDQFPNIQVVSTVEGALEMTAGAVAQCALGERQH